MKRLLIILMAAMLLTACGNKEEAGPLVEGSEQEQVNEQESEIITEVISNSEHDVVLFDNEDLKMTLLNSIHERYENARGKDKIEFTLELENKKNRTFEFFIEELTLDGVETNDAKTFFDAEEIAPNETISINLTTFTETDLDDFELNFKEHISGKIIFNDHEGNQIDTDFSEYIIET